MSESVDGIELVPVALFPQSAQASLNGILDPHSVGFCCIPAGLGFTGAGCLDLVLVMVRCTPAQALAAEEASMTSVGHLFGFVVAETRLSPNTLFIIVKNKNKSQDTVDNKNSKDAITLNLQSIFQRNLEQFSVFLGIFLVMGGGRGVPPAPRVKSLGN